ncbi:hypothetical protein [Prevotella pallens]|uniref:hypothetical protein n=1 Tax=Prevotella pallens TaxID=60133 RepID=UPI001CB445F3|nr:hypothetical protein [Prevotella pallens]MBF1479164.1 hypothetical protein [Prevotella pallens]
MQYEKVYIQKVKKGAVIKETIADFDIYCADMPFRLFAEAKDLSKRDWFEEHGDDEYIPEDCLKLKSYTMDVKFCCKGDKFSSNEKFKKFLNYLVGLDGSGTEMKMYCTWTKIGRTGIRFDKLNDKAELIRDEDGDTLVFTITFKVNDPITDVNPVIDTHNVVIGLR